MTFLPTDYKIPKSASGYMKFDDGINSFRVLSPAIVGFVYFTKDNKPVRSKEAFDEIPDDMKDGGKIKAFWAFCVWNYQLKQIQILEVTQKSIMTAIKALVDNPKWGDPKMYDIAVTKSGQNLDTEYSVQGEPPIGEPSDEIKTAYSVKYVNLEALYLGLDPFQKG